MDVSLYANEKEGSTDTPETNTDLLSEEEIKITCRVKERLALKGYRMTDFEMLSHAVLFRRLRLKWDVDAEKPDTLEVLVSFGVEEEVAKQYRRQGWRARGREGIFGWLRRVRALLGWER